MKTHLQVFEEEFRKQNADRPSGQVTRLLSRSGGTYDLEATRAAFEWFMIGMEYEEKE